MDVENDLRTESKLPVDRSKTGLPDHNNTSPKGEFLSLKVNLKAPSRHSRRSFLRMLGLGTIGIATGGAAYALLPRNDASAAILPPTLDSKTEPLNLTASEVFGGNVTTEAELRKNPDDISDFKLVTDTQGNVSEIVLLARDDKSVGKSLDDKSVAVFVSRMILNQQTKRFDPAFQTHRTPFSILAESVIKVGKKIVIGGQTEWSSGIPVLFESVNSVRPFEPIAISANNLVGVSEMNQIPNTSRVILNLGASLAILDLETNKIVEILSDARNGVVITATSADSQTTSVYSKRNLSGLSRELINLSTDQVIESRTYFQGLDIDGYCFIKDANNNITKILVTENAGQTFRILDLTTNTTSDPKSFAGWLNNSGIPGIFENSLQITALHADNNRIWAAGSYDSRITRGNHVIVLSWFLSSNPATDPKALTVIRVEDQVATGHPSQQDFKKGIFGNRPGFLVKVDIFGLFFIETKQDGSPIEGITPIYLSIRDQAAPTANIPVVLNTVRN